MLLDTCILLSWYYNKFNFIMNTIMQMYDIIYLLDKREFYILNNIIFHKHQYSSIKISFKNATVKNQRQVHYDQEK